MSEISERDRLSIERTTKEVGRHLFAHLQTRRPTVIERRWWEDRIVAWAMQDERVKTQLFRFVDVLPMLGTSRSVVEHLHEYFDPVEQSLPRTVRFGLHLAPPDTLAGRALAIAARRNVLGQARRFIAGSTTDEVLAAAMRERKLRRAFSLDLLGEAVASDAEADRYVAAYLDLIRTAAPIVNAWTEVPQVDRGLFAALPRLNLSVKLSAMDPRFNPLDPEGTTRRVGRRLRELIRAARAAHAFIHVDMESYDKKNATFAVFQNILAEDEFRDFADVGIVVQAYLKDAAGDLSRLYDWAARRGAPIWVRLVKGAYWDYETVHARAVGWPVPVYEHKPQTDANFEALTRWLLPRHEVLRPAIASHNIRSLAHAIAVARHIGLHPSGWELQLLYGMGDPEKQALVDLGHRVRIYMPFGELIPGMAYLVRRLLENTSNDSFLRASFIEGASTEELLMNPEERAAAKTVSAASQVLARPSGDGAPRCLSLFTNEPPTDFSLDSNRQAMQSALAAVRAAWGQHYPLVIDGVRVQTDRQIISLNPSCKDQVVGTAASASEQDVQRAVAAARRALASWSGRGAHARAQLLRTAAAILSARRFELASWIVHEAGKGWIEADADVAEAIDFCRYYAAGAEAMEHPPHIDAPGEENRLDYLPRGVAAVIAPWNFPLAILTGMTAAALATGNTVVMKPAEQTPIVAARLMEAFEAAGVPPGVVNYLPGAGDVAGRALVEHPDVALIAFTGSRDVGLAINRRAAEVSAHGNQFVKHVIAEMGGKNAIVIDDDADLDEAVPGVIKSAFSYQGQKCSACSRVVVLESVCRSFVDRLVEAARSLKIAPADLPSSDLGPVIDEESFQRIGRYIEIAKTEGRELLAVSAGELANRGYYIGPHIYADVAPSARIAQEEIFGPVLAILTASDFDEAIQLVNNTPYGLTGGVFSRSPRHLAQARREILVGNLYLNRAITGALVGRQPFGGFKMSGIGTKAGGPDYLLQFVVPRTVTENTIRRGFAPSGDGALGTAVEQAELGL
jgi:RHH-type proline utilization regulon transcriptional repressor/proline dehydrogenase/delta 1-pyrroline-5-carboxylate dehydrogenase